MEALERRERICHGCTKPRSGLKIQMQSMSRTTNKEDMDKDAIILHKIARLSAYS